MNLMFSSFISARLALQRGNRRGSAAWLVLICLLGSAVLVSAAEPKQMAGVWRGHSTGKESLAFGIVKAERDDQFTVSDDLRTVILLPLGAAAESGGKMEKVPVHSAPTTLTTEATLENGELVARRVVRYSTGEDRQTWTFSLQSPSVLRVKLTSSYIDKAGGQISWRKMEGTLQRN